MACEGFLHPSALTEDGEKTPVKDRDDAEEQEDGGRSHQTGGDDRPASRQEGREGLRSRDEHLYGYRQKCSISLITHNSPGERLPREAWRVDHIADLCTGKGVAWFLLKQPAGYRTHFWLNPGLKIVQTPIQSAVRDQWGKRRSNPESDGDERECHGRRSEWKARESDRDEFKAVSFYWPAENV